MCAPAQMMQGGDGLQYLLDRVSQLESAPGGNKKKGQEWYYIQSTLFLGRLHALKSTLFTSRFRDQVSQLINAIHICVQISIWGLSKRKV